MAGSQLLKYFNTVKNIQSIIIYIPSVEIPTIFPPNSIIMGYAQLLPDKMFMRGIELDWVELS